MRHTGHVIDGSSMACHYATVIKGRLEAKDGRNTLIVGLSGEDMTRLMADEPIIIGAVELKAMGFSKGVDEVIIIGGRNEDAMVADLTRVNSPERVVDYRKGERV